MTFGLAEFVAAEEMGRSRGYWWSPDGGQLLIARVDESAGGPLAHRRPRQPGQGTRARSRYPAAGTANADVSLLIATLRQADAGRHRAHREHPARRLPPASAKLTEVAGWDRAAFPYLVNAAWGDDLLIVVQTRDQKTMRIINAVTGEVLREDTDPHWTDVIEGVPAQLADGDIVWTGISGDTRGPDRRPGGRAGRGRAGHPARAAGPGRCSAPTATTCCSPGRPSPPSSASGAYGPAGLAPVATEPGVHAATAGGGTDRARQPDAGQQPGRTVRIRAARRGHRAASPRSRSSRTCRTRRRSSSRPGPAGIRTAVLFPSWHQPGTKLPVLMDPYGGPGMQRVVKAASMFLTSQWFAEQGFAVVVADGRGTPGRGPSWDKTIAGDFATGVLEDQVTALGAAAGEVRRPGHRPGSPSAAGRSAGTCRRSRCCAAPTCSTRRWRARRSPTGGSTTPTTPSATWATRPRTPPPTSELPPRRPGRAGQLPSGRCSSFTGSPTTTCSSRTRCGCRRRCWRPGTRTRSCRCPASPT